MMYQGFLNNRIAGEPEFKNDKETTPLQAADLMAWHFRRNLVAHEEGKTFESDVWTELLEAPHRITGLWTPPMLRLLARKAVLKHRLLSLPAVPMTIPDPSSFLWGGKR
jgi:hypothetical protein